MIIIHALLIEIHLIANSTISYYFAILKINFPQTLLCLATPYPSLPISPISLSCTQKRLAFYLPC